MDPAGPNPQETARQGNTGTYTQKGSPMHTWQMVVGIACGSLVAAATLSGLILLACLKAAKWADEQIERMEIAEAEL